MIETYSLSLSLFITSGLSLLVTKATNLIVSYCVTNQIHALHNAVHSHFEMRYKIKCQYSKQVLRKKGKRIPKHISDLWYQTKVTMLQAQAWNRPICFTLSKEVEIYLQKPKLLLSTIWQHVPTNPMEWVSVHQIADTPKSKIWRLYKTGIMVKVSQCNTVITKLQTETAVNLFSFSEERSTNTQPNQYHQQVAETASLSKASIIPTHNNIWDEVLEPKSSEIQQII